LAHLFVQLGAFLLGPLALATGFPIQGRRRGSLTPVSCSMTALASPGGTYWKTWDRHIREHLLRGRLISPDDLNLYHITDDTDKAVKIITRFYRNFQSSRFVKDLLVIRLKNAPPGIAIPRLNKDFANIITGTPIKIIKPTPEEREDNDCLDLVRVAFGFNRHDYGRPRQLIDVLNGL
jgi:hypothetical protein